MTIGDATLLGILQGVTEFLPISSSGHLVVAEDLMDISPSGLLFEVVVHLGTLGSILVVFGRDIVRLLRNPSSAESRMLAVYLVIGSVPVFVAGLAFRSRIETAFQNLHVVGLAFLVTGTVLILTSFVRGVKGEMDGRKSFLVGLSQALALLPGISRSGMTISTGLLLGLHPQEAARFSFLLAIPALFGSGAVMIRDILTLRPDAVSPSIMAAGFATSFAVGILSLRILLRILIRGRFHWFGIYCLVLGFLTIGR